MAQGDSRRRSVALSTLSTCHSLIVHAAAHLIRNASSGRHRSVRLLKAQHRWCLTGTPIFNRVEDLGALLSFLRVYPFDSGLFATHITRLIKKDPDQGLENLRNLITAVSLRRTKASVLGDLQLTPRKNKVEHVQLNASERRLYIALRKGFHDHVSHSFSSFEESMGPGRVFQTINKLRQLCNLGCAMFPQDTLRRFSEIADPECLIEPLLDSPEACHHCTAELTSEVLEQVTISAFPCGHRFCSACMEQTLDDCAIESQDCPTCSSVEASNKVIECGIRDDDIEDAFNRSDYEPSSKVLALLKNLRAERAKPHQEYPVKRYVNSSG
jgi:SNF2 family DNA or RNA helicase